VRLVEVGCTESAAMDLEVEVVAAANTDVVVYNDDGDERILVGEVEEESMAAEAGWILEVVALELVEAAEVAMAPIYEPLLAARSLY
jgi:hypothetical protein